MAKVGKIQNIDPFVMLTYSKKSLNKVSDGKLPEVLHLAFGGDHFDLSPGDEIQLPSAGAKHLVDQLKGCDPTSIAANVIFEVKELVAKASREVAEDVEAEVEVAKRKPGRPPKEG